MTAAEFNLLKSLVLPKIDEIRTAWKASTDEEETNELGYQLSIASRAWDSIERAYDEFYKPF